MFFSSLQIFISLPAFVGTTHSHTQRKSLELLAVEVQPSPEIYQHWPAGCYGQLMAAGRGYEEQPTTSGSALAPGSPKNKVKFLCSYGSKILPRPADNHLKYVGGEIRVISVPRDISFPGKPLSQYRRTTV